MDSWRLDFSISSPLSMNDRVHWRRRSEDVAALRYEAKLLAINAKIPRLQRCSVELFYQPRDARRRDPINLAATLKPIQDGLVDARVVPDDAPQYMESPMPFILPPGGGRRGAIWVVVKDLSQV